jgi:hypothetical protein
MRKRPFLAVFACAFALAGAASANPMDLTLSRLNNGVYSGDTDPRHSQYESCVAALARLPDPITGVVRSDQSACANQTAFRELSREFGLAVAPALLAPAETLGYAGFYLGLEGTITTINSDNSNRQNVWYMGTEDQNPDGALFVASIHARKGLPFSFELGTTVSYISATEDVLLGVDIRWALLEGYRTGWKAYFPDISVRGAVNRLTGDDEMDLTVWTIDAALSHPFAISGMMTITPFGGYQFVQTIADTSLVLNGMANPDGTGRTLIQCDSGPDHADYQTGCIGDVNGPALRYLDFAREYIDRHRLYVGLRFIYEHFSATLEGAFTLDPADQSSQQTFAASLGFDY